MNITLIGMSGAGKSHAGKQLAEKLSLRFFDVDTEMELQYGKSLQDILDELGEDAFVRKQADMLLALFASDGLVISTGGSVVYSEDAMLHLKQISKIVFLDVPCETIEKRISIQNRGIVGLKDKSFTELFVQRQPLYKKWADVTMTPAMTEDQLLQHL